MKTHVLGKTGLQVSVLGFGTSQIGWHNLAFAEADRLLHTAVDLGMNVIETGECYGYSEDYVGRSLERRRHDLILCTNAGHDWSFEQGHQHAWSRVLVHLEQSLKRLRTDCIDLWQIHGCPLAAFDGYMTDAIAKAKGEGKIRYAGYSAGYSGPWKLAQYIASLGFVDVIQVPDLRGLARPRAVGIIANQPFGGGHWSFKLGLGRQRRRRALCEAIARADCVLIGSTNPAHVVENVGLLE